MGRKPIQGICKLCGKKTILTYEHVPPRGAFNNHSIKEIRGDQLIEHIGSDEKPWEISHLRGNIHQQGTGGYYLCKDCNEKTGSWYVPYYLDFIYGIYSAIEKADPERETPYIGIQATSIRPLPILKEIMVMFCDINNNCFGDKNLRSFLLNRNSTQGFDKNKYRLFCYIVKGNLHRMNGIIVKLITSKDREPVMITLSEISFPPLGFVLYIDLPDEYKPEGCEITKLADAQYEDKAECEMLLPVLENNIMFSGDYRTKAEIEKTMQDSKEWEEAHKELINEINNRRDNP